MIGYFDSSALVKLVLDEVESALAAEVWERCDAAVSSLLAIPEVFSALDAATRAHCLNFREMARAQDAWSRLSRLMRWVELTTPLAQVAGDLATRYPLSGADATHLASGLTLGQHGTLFVTWDRRLSLAAQGENLLVLPGDMP